MTNDISEILNSINDVRSKIAASSASIEQIIDRLDELEKGLLRSTSSPVRPVDRQSKARYNTEDELS